MRIKTYNWKDDMGNNKDFKKFESFLVCIIITILMVLAGIYTDILKNTVYYPCLYGYGH